MSTDYKIELGFVFVDIFLQFFIHSFSASLNSGVRVTLSLRLYRNRLTQPYNSFKRLNKQPQYLVLPRGKYIYVMRGPKFRNNLAKAKTLGKVFDFVIEMLGMIRKVSETYCANVIMQQIEH